MQICSVGSLQTGDPGREPHVSGQPLVIRLSHPIEAHGEQVTELHLGELTVGMLEGIEMRVEEGAMVWDLGIIARFLSNAAAIPPSAAKLHRRRDLIGAREELQDFFVGSLQTGLGESKTSDTSSTGRQASSTD